MNDAQRKLLFELIGESAEQLPEPLAQIEWKRIALDTVHFRLGGRREASAATLLSAAGLSIPGRARQHAGRRESRARCVAQSGERLRRRRVEAARGC
jgi:hypothetical protein